MCDMHETIVIGAGPAGSAAASTLARSGIDVLLVDRAVFPRDKPCGDGVGIDSVEELQRMEIWDAVKAAKFRAIHGVEYIAPDGTSLEMNFPISSHENNFVAPRPEFDNILRKGAISQGAEFRQLNVVGPLIENDRVCGILAIEGDQQISIRCQTLIVADGSNSITANRLRNSKYRSQYVGIAWRGYVKTAVKQDHKIRAFFSSELLPGYVWWFPIDDHTINVGIGTTFLRYQELTRSLPTIIKSALLHFPCDHLEIGQSHSISDGKLWTLNLGCTQERRSFPGAILVGDAGGFVNPATGGGIANALKTGRLSAEATLRALQDPKNIDLRLSEFDVTWKNQLWPQLRNSYFIQQKLMRHSIIVNWLVRSLVRQSSLSKRFSQKIAQMIQM
jgi:menaquinone-9 beta-reductase